MIKVDIEGHEPHLLKGARRTLSSSALQAVIMETKSNISELMEGMMGYGFSAHRYDAETRQLHPVEEPPPNTIFLRNAAMVEQRCRSAPRFTLVNGSI